VDPKKKGERLLWRRDAGKNKTNENAFALFHSAPSVQSSTLVPSVFCYLLLHPPLFYIVRTCTKTNKLLVGTCPHVERVLARRLDVCRVVRGMDRGRLEVEEREEEIEEEEDDVKSQPTHGNGKATRRFNDGDLSDYKLLETDDNLDLQLPSFLDLLDDFDLNHRKRRSNRLPAGTPQPGPFAVKRQLDRFWAEIESNLRDLGSELQIRLQRSNPNRFDPLSHLLTITLQVFRFS
jgi:DNA-directed RNA polymerase beta' subunit